jgi:hypothetical protein
VDEDLEIPIPLGLATDEILNGSSSRDIRGEGRLIFLVPGL